jgi:DNA polymerase I-like protein with 3'-5' exonuclease and polymerase domains
MHKYAGSLMLNKPVAAITKDERQATKVLNFGVPGGLGAASLAEYAYAMYGLRWSEKEAAAHRNRYLEVFDDVNAYLCSMKQGQDTLLRKVTGLGRKDWAEALETDNWNIIKTMVAHENPEIAALGQECERQLTIELPTGFRRANCRFTEGANCHFQGLAAAVTKEAKFLALRAGLEVSLVVHDEIIIQHDPWDTDRAARLLEQVMLQAFRRVCPNLGPYAKVEVTAGITRWGPATDAKGAAIEL